MMKLFLCEKPSQGRDIGRVLGAKPQGDKKGFLATSDGSVVVTWAVGHLLTQYLPEDYDPKLKQWKLEFLPIIPDVWKMKPSEGTKTQYNLVVKLLQKASEVVIATDIDREGETIARELLSMVQFKGKISRLWLSALDDESIRKGLKNLKRNEETLPLYYAGLARSRADWLIGLNFTRLYTAKAQQLGYNGILSVGRVQTPTLALIVNRDKQIQHFQPTQHYKLFVQLANRQQGETFSAEFPLVQIEEVLNPDGLCLNYAVLSKIGTAIQNAGAVKATKVAKVRKKENPPLPFSLSKLQQECNKLFGLGAQQVLDIAQDLYEKHKLTTYPRSDCTYLPMEQFADAKKISQAVLCNLSDKVEKAIVSEQLDFSLTSRAWNNAKITAHHAIIPTATVSQKTELTKDERNVYELICKHYLAQFLPCREYDETEVEFETQTALSAKPYLLQTKGKRIVKNGWGLLFPTSKQEETILPTIIEQQNYAVLNTDTKTLTTTPPARFTEGTLISAMVNAGRFVEDEKLKKQLKDSEGLGTEATRGDIIENLFQKGLIAKKGKNITATPAGIALVQNVSPVLTNPVMTAMWEQQLSLIAQGKASLSTFMEKQEAMLKMLVKNNLHSEINLSGVKIKSCPQCGHALVKRVSKKTGNTFFGCSNYPNCEYIENIQQKNKPKKTEKQNGEQILRTKKYIREEFIRF